MLEITSFNSQTWLTLGEQIIKYCIKLSRNCHCCNPVDFFTFVLCVWIAFTYTAFQTSTHLIVTWGWIGWTDIIWSQTCSVQQPLICMLYGQLHHLAGRTCSPSPNQLDFQKPVVKFVHCTFLNCIQKEDGFDYSSHTSDAPDPNLNLCISLGSSAVLNNMWLFW